MARIEISLEEFNSFQRKINDLHEKISEEKKEKEILKEEIDSLTDDLQILLESNLYDRTLGWNGLKKILSHNLTTKNND